MTILWESCVAVERVSKATIGRSSWTAESSAGGREAEAIGLVDQLGDLDTAFTVAKRLAGIDRADLFVVHRPLDYVASAYADAALPMGTTAPGSTQVNLMQLNLGGLASSRAEGACYLWQPSFSVP